MRVAGDANQGAVRIGKLADDKATRRCGLAHHPSPTKLLRALQRGFDVRNGDVEDGVALVPRASDDAAADSRPVLGRHEVEEPVAVWLRDFFCNGRGCVELPAEEITAVAAKSPSARDRGPVP